MLLFHMQQAQTFFSIMDENKNENLFLRKIISKD